MIGRACQWWIGDWLNYGERAYGEKYAQAMGETGLDYASLQNYSWVAGKVETSLRRDVLSWSHHKEVAALDPPEQADWLARAEAPRGYHRSGLIASPPAVRVAASKEMGPRRANDRPRGAGLHNRGARGRLMIARPASRSRGGSPMNATETETADFIRWDVLDNLHEQLTTLADQVRELADELKPGKLAMLDAPGNARLIRSYFDALDEIGWYSAEQMEAAG